MHLSRDTWQQIKAGYAAGIGLREIARKMNVPDGTVLARAKREEWTQQIAAARIARQPQLAKEIVKARAINAITPMQSIAAVMQQRGERYRERMADVSDKVAGHLESLDADEILLRSAQVEKIAGRFGPVRLRLGSGVARSAQISRAQSPRFFWPQSVTHFAGIRPGTRSHRVSPAIYQIDKAR
jgi:ABC-type lipoprotein release transport system permease subunit